MKILMIGNSATYYHDIPKTLEELIRENGTDVTIDSVTKGGRKLHENLNPYDEYHKKIKELCTENEYDLLFLQEQTVLPLSQQELFSDSVKNLMDIVKAKRTILYATPPRKDGAKFLIESNMTVLDMAKGIAAAYEKTAKENNAELSDATTCFYNVMKAYPEINLHAEDLAHTSYAGSIVAVLSHYKAIFGKLPEKDNTINLDQEILNRLKNIVDKTF